MSDQARLDEIRTRAQAATPEPWGWLAYEPSTLVSYDYLGDPVAEKYGLRPRVLATGEYNRKTPSRHDADFIAHARDDVPYLLDLVASLTTERDMWHDDATKLDAMAVKLETERDALLAAARRVTKMWNETNPDAWDANEWEESHDALAALSDDQEERDATK